MSTKSVPAKHRAPRPGRRYAIQKDHVAMELMATVSRSSGLEKDGDTLKNFKVQEEYRVFIQGKLDNFWSRYPLDGAISASDARYGDSKNAQENILILFRKLREGVFSSQRRDAFAVEVYETSSYLAVLFDSPKQVSSILLHLVPELYLAVSVSCDRCLPTILISLLHNLVSNYPSQGVFRERLRTIPNSLLPPNGPAHLWISSLSSCIRSQNYVKFEELMRPKAFAHLLKEGSTQSTEKIISDSNLCNRAFTTAVDKLQSLSRQTTWSIIRHAYRELSFCPESKGTRDWLERSLALQSSVPGAATDVSVERWLKDKTAEGHLRPKEGTEGKYIVCKV